MDITLAPVDNEPPALLNEETAAMLAAEDIVALHRFLLLPKTARDALLERYYEWLVDNGGEVDRRDITIIMRGLPHPAKALILALLGHWLVHFAGN